MIPDDWSPTVDHRARAIEFGLDVAIEAAEFRRNRDDCRGVCEDPDAEFATWIAQVSQLPPTITAVCRSFYGHCNRFGRWSPPNRCDVCPLSQPCRVWGASQSRTTGERDAQRAEFVGASLAILAGGAR